MVTNTINKGGKGPCAKAIKYPAAVTKIPPRSFDEGYATWVGITPDDTKRRNQERDEFQKLAKTDIRAYYEAMKEWGLNREKRFTDEGWREMGGHHRVS